MKPNETCNELGKVCPGDNFPTQQRILDDAHIPGIGQWLIDHEKTQSWLNGKKGNRVLWLHGPSASGKTFLSSTLVNHIHQNNSMGVGVGVFYFGRNDQQHKLADYDLAFRSISRQLLSQLPDSRWQTILGVLDVGIEDVTSTPDMLGMMTGDFDKMIVVLDGVEDMNNEGLGELLEFLFVENEIPSLRLLITSRQPDFDARWMEDFGLVEVEARPSDLDIALYLSKYIDESPVNPEVLDESHTKRFPYQKFIDISNGLFLPLEPKWFSNIASQPNKTLLDLVESESADVPNAFCHSLVKDVQSSEQSGAILCVLYHIVKWDEMGYFFTAPMAREALHVWGITDQDGTQFATDKIIEFCESFIFVDHNTEAMVLRSPLFLDHLRNAVFGVEYHERQAIITIRYLSKPEFSNGGCKSTQELRKRFQAHPYLGFAATCNLPRFLPPSFETDFFTFADSHGNVDSYQQAKRAWPYHDTENHDECEKETWVCYTRGTTPLGLAVTLGNESILRSVINRGADLEGRDEDGQRALDIAAMNEDESSMLEVLLQAGSNVAASDECSLTPLALAAIYGRLESVKLLVQFGADIGKIDQEDVRQCMEERPGIVEYLATLGVGMLGDDDEEY